MLKRRASLLAGQTLVFAAFFGLWELAVRLLHTRPVILPAPSVIFAKIWEQRELLLVNTWPTCVAITLGFAAAVLSGFILAVAISYSRAVRELTYPFLVTAQVLPKVAFAPLFLIWFGFGITPKT
jgi:NitT/TauT family transport system permease protein